MTYIDAIISDACERAGYTPERITTMLMGSWRQSLYDDEPWRDYLPATLIDAWDELPFEIRLVAFLIAQKKSDDMMDHIGKY